MKRFTLYVAIFGLVFSLGLGSGVQGDPVNDGFDSFPNGALDGWTVSPQAASPAPLSNPSSVLVATATAEQISVTNTFPKWTGNYIAPSPLPNNVAALLAATVATLNIHMVLESNDGNFWITTTPQTPSGDLVPAEFDFPIPGAANFAAQMTADPDNSGTNLATYIGDIVAVVAIHFCHFDGALDFPPDGDDTVTGVFAMDNVTFGDDSLAVALSSFTASTTGDGVLVSWRTESETSNLGFNIYRSRTKDGTYELVTPALIKGHGTDSTSNNYTFLDESAQDGETYWYIVEDIDFGGVTTRSNPVQAQAFLLRENLLPTRFVLHQNYPNPFNPETWMPYDLAGEATVNISIYNPTGQVIRTLNLGTQSAGSYLGKDKAAYWDGRTDTGELVSSGMYYYHFRAGEFNATRKMLILK